MTDLVYLYGFIRPDTSPPGDLTGIEDRPVEVLPLGPLAAAISRVPAEHYRPEALDAHMRDLDWVGARGVRHERVVTRFLDEAWILPARLLTLFSSPEALREEVAAREAELLRQLERFEGSHEWDLKVRCDAARLRPHLATLSEEVGRLEERLDLASPGTQYLLERKRQDMVAEETRRVARRLSRELLEGLARLALDVREVPTPREVEGLPVVLNAALLVRPTAEGGLRSEVDRRTAELERMGLEVTFSGPWAPYRFLEAFGE